MKTLREARDDEEVCSLPSSSWPRRGRPAHPDPSSFHTQTHVHYRDSSWGEGRGNQGRRGALQQNRRRALKSKLWMQWRGRGRAVFEFLEKRRPSTVGGRRTIANLDNGRHDDRHPALTQKCSLLSLPSLFSLFTRGDPEPRAIVVLPSKEGGGRGRHASGGRRRNCPTAAAAGARVRTHERRVAG